MNPYGIAAPTAIDLAELATYNAGVTLSRLAYENAKTRADRDAALDASIDYAARTAASQKQIRYRARKKGKQ